MSAPKPALPSSAGVLRRSPSDAAVLRRSPADAVVCRGSPADFAAYSDRARSAPEPTRARQPDQHPDGPRYWYEKACEHCAVAFKAQLSTATYCSARCRGAAWRERQR
jgi:hypothetical protein